MTQARRRPVAEIAHPSEPTLGDLAVGNVVGWLVFGAYLLTALWLYWPALDAYFASEDLTHVRWGAAEIAVEFGAAGVTVGFRPGTVAYMAANNFVWGRWAAGHRTMALALHALNGWFVFALMRRVRRDSGSRDLYAIAAGLLFVSAAVHSEAVIWLAAASGTVTSAALCLAAAWLWSRGEDRPSQRTTLVVAALYLSAMLVKEVAVALPGLLLALDWGLGRLRPREASVLRYLGRAYAPQAAVLGIYALLYWRSGAWISSAGYGFGQLSAATLVAQWRLYLHDLWMPLSGLRGGVASAWDWVWIGAFVVLFVGVARARWALAWTAAALLPVATTYGERLLYLAVAGMSMALALAMQSIVERASRLNDGRLGKRAAMVACGVGVAAILVLNRTAIWADARNWVAAGELAWSIPRQAQALVPQPSPGAELYFADLPDNVGGAYALRWGIGAEVRTVYGDVPIRVFHVLDGAGGKTALASIACRSDAERYFFRYDPSAGVLRRVSAEEFGVRCTGL